MLEDQDFQDVLDSLNFCLRLRNLGGGDVKLVPNYIPLKKCTNRKRTSFTFLVCLKE